MSIVSHASSEALVTIKVTFQGLNRRAKMPLRDMVPRVLEDNIRSFLHIPIDNRILIERWSDSAAAFVVLDSSNLSVYKQLYRAAKAKSKLKLRVSLLDVPARAAPKPATVEDAPEELTSTTQTTLVETAAEPTRVPPFVEPMNFSDAMSVRFSLPVRNAMPLVNVEDEQAKESTATEDAPEPETTMDMAEKDADSTTLPPTFCNPFDAHASFLPTFAVCCNACDETVSDAHYHCGTCDDGDYDLCQDCVDRGVTCRSADHWLIKRTLVDGRFVSSNTETIAPIVKPKTEEPVTEKTPLVPEIPEIPCEPSGSKWSCLGNMRTCNCCVQELPEKEFLHCDTCEDYDLCRLCFIKDNHGHHPKHGFEPAVAGTAIPDYIKVKMAAGRNVMHAAICDGCDKYVHGIRHKCLDCPDWDYCSECIKTATTSHRGHRFAPVYEPLAEAQLTPVAQPVHQGICCDGPLCSNGLSYPTYIRGVRYKCTVCHDLDFCANCEASPVNYHNKTHPLIMLKTPVRHVNVTTTGEHQDGKRMPTMGDRCTRRVSKSPEVPKANESNAINAVQTVVDVKPVPEPIVEKAVEEPAKEPVKEIVAESPLPTPEHLEEQELRAVFLRDSVVDGTIFPPNHVFEQTWVLRNEGKVAWPAGCSVKFVGGDYMGHVDSAHPACISELISASESTVCYAPLAPGAEFPFTVLLRTPIRAGKMISYWRLTTADGFKFGHRLWCDINVHVPSVEAVKPVEEAKEVKEVKVEESESNPSDSVMIFPKLEKESPVSSIHEEEARSETNTMEKETECDSLGEIGEDEAWDGSDDEFLTDEEYDILDASDEELDSQSRAS